MSSDLKGSQQVKDTKLFRRFLENCEAGVRLVKKEQFVPFGFGRRVCMGEALAKDTLLIFFATLIKQIR